MVTQADAVTDADDRFFAALLAADTAALDAILADDFVIVDVMSGGVSDRAVIIGAIASGDLRFVEVRRDTAQRGVRERPGACVVVGRTRMTMEFRGARGTVESRYTHVFVPDGDGWRLLSAQGTPVVEQPAR